MTDMEDGQPLSRKSSLFLFGGWTHPSIYPLHQTWRLFNELHRQKEKFLDCFLKIMKLIIYIIFEFLDMTLMRKIGLQCTLQRTWNRPQWLAIQPQSIQVRSLFLEASKSNVPQLDNFRARMMSGPLISKVKISLKF
jgi:hypothetical protein